MAFQNVWLALHSISLLRVFCFEQWGIYTVWGTNAIPNCFIGLTSVVLFTPPGPHIRDQTHEDNRLGKCTFSSYRQEHSSTENFAVYQTHCPFYQKKRGLLSLARG